MKFKTNRSSLHQAAQRLLNIVPPRSSLPILSNIIFELDKSKLSLKATDLDISMITTLDVEGQEDGSVAIPAKVFFEVIKELPDFDLEISTDGNRVKIECGAGSYKVSGFPSEDFPKIPEVNKAQEFKLDGKMVSRMIKKVLFAVCRDETRPALNGILWHQNDQGFNMVATDGHRLAKVSRTDLKVADSGKDLIIPPKVLDSLVKLMGDEPSEIGVVIEKGFIAFILENSILVSRLLEGPYPDYERVVPKDNDKSASIDKEILASSVRRVAVLSNSLTHQIKFGFKSKELELSATNFDFGGEAVENLMIGYSSEVMEIGFNAAYMTDTLKQIDGNEVVVKFKSPTTAVIFESQSKTENENSYFLIMPLRLID